MAQYGHFYHEVLLLCPYNPAHAIIKSRIQTHLVKCMKTCTGEASELLTCPYDATHRIEPSKIVHHINNCPAQGSVLNFKYTVGETGARHESFVPIENREVECEENWDEDETPSYDPGHRLQDARLLVQVKGATPSEREQFRQMRREMYNNMCMNMEANRDGGNTCNTQKIESSGETEVKENVPSPSATTPIAKLMAAVTLSITNKDASINETPDVRPVKEQQNETIDEYILNQTVTHEPREENYVVSDLDSCSVASASTSNWKSMRGNLMKRGIMSQMVRYDCDTSSTDDEQHHLDALSIEAPQLPSNASKRTLSSASSNFFDSETDGVDYSNLKSSYRKGYKPVNGYTCKPSSTNACSSFYDSETDYTTFKKANSAPQNGYFYKPEGASSTSGYDSPQSTSNGYSAHGKKGNEPYIPPKNNSYVPAWGSKKFTMQPGFDNDPNLPHYSMDFPAVEVANSTITENDGASSNVEYYKSTGAVPKRIVKPVAQYDSGYVASSASKGSEHMDQQSTGSSGKHLHKFSQKHRNARFNSGASRDSESDFQSSSHGFPTLEESNQKKANFPFPPPPSWNTKNTLAAKNKTKKLAMPLKLSDAEEVSYYLPADYR